MGSESLNSLLACPYGETNGGRYPSDHGNLDGFEPRKRIIKHKPLIRLVLSIERCVLKVEMNFTTSGLICILDILKFACVFFLFQ